MPLVIYGDENDKNYQRIEIDILPCNSLYTDLGPIFGELDQVGPACVTSLESQIDYLGQVHLMILTNQVQFKHEEYGENKLVRKSTILNRQFDSSQPSWIHTTL